MKVKNLDFDRPLEDISIFNLNRVFYLAFIIKTNT